MLDFSARKQRLMDLKLHDGTLLQIPVPNAGTYDEILDISAEGRNISIIPSVVIILNQNQQGINFTPEQVERMFTVADLSVIYAEFIKFVGDAINDPN